MIGSGAANFTLKILVANYDPEARSLDVDFVL